MKVKLGVGVLAAAAVLALGAAPVSADTPIMVCEGAKGPLYTLPDPGGEKWAAAVQQCIDDGGHPAALLKK